jgi:hypothetical protein
MLRDRSAQLSVAVLGERGVGKTTLLHLWAGKPTGDLPPTVLPRKYEPVRIHVDGHKFLLRAGYDVSGSKDAWRHWKPAVKDGHVVYLADARRLAAEAGYEPQEPPPNPPESPPRVLRDARQIRLWREEFQPKDWRCVLAVTHRDADPRFPSRTGQASYDSIISEQLDEVVQTLGGRGRVAVTTGSLVPPALGGRLKDDIIRLLLSEWA